MNNEHENPGREYAERSEKQKRWHEVSVNVDNIRDKLGKRVDAGIKEVLVALQVNDFQTTMSCEGHDEKGTGGPYIDVGIPISAEQRSRYTELRDKEDQESIDSLRALQKEVSGPNLIQQKRMIEMLREFYETRNTPFDIRLTMQARGNGGFRIESQGVILQKIEDDPTAKVKRLKEFQAEINAFKEFLRSKYFGE